ncbi:hypothetical protein CK203_027828 [Vitis vinifera]|uniref:Uncharacterized protein n=1 Tax=Vitis vinifera TaxID=29760 RepID=A0A438J3G7_VITVI|nr:hypothetical protein CK203_027828 [Vitis vinifera]
MEISNVLDSTANQHFPPFETPLPSKKAFISPWGQVSSVADTVLTAATAIVDNSNNGDDGGEVLGWIVQSFVQ